MTQYLRSRYARTRTKVRMCQFRHIPPYVDTTEIIPEI